MIKLHKNCPQMCIFMKTSILISLPPHPEPSTASRTFTKEDPVTLIRRLKEEDGAGIWIVGAQSGSTAFGS